MKNKLFLLMMIIAATSTSNAQVNIHSKNGNFRIIQATEHLEGIEERAYNDLLRVVDEVNRKNGIYSNYMKKAKTKESRIRDKVDLVPVATYTDDYNNFKAEFGSVIEAKRGQNYHEASSLIEKGSDAFSKEEVDNLGYHRNGTQKRFYFGNGNVVKDITFATKDSFENKMADIKNNKNDRYILEGTYRSINTKDLNQLDISMEDYYSKIQGKSRSEVAEFLKSKMLEKNIEVFRKGDELYTKDDNGKEWKVLWTLEPVSIYETLHTDENKRFKDTILTKIYTYDSSVEPNNSAGRIVYTKDGNIILEDKYTYNNDLKIKHGSSWQTNYTNLNEIIKNAKEKAEKGASSGENAIENYFIDKKNLSSEEFEKKWVTPFEDGGEFYKDLKNMKNEIDKVNNQLKIASSEYDEAVKKINEFNSSGKLPNDFAAWSWKYKSEKEKADYLASKTQVERDIISEFLKYKDIQDTKFDEKINLELQIQEGIPKKYGFYNGWRATEEQKKWMDRVVWDNNVIKDLLGKNVELRGKGKIEGTIDLGEGDNHLTIREQFTGRYGTNIILGPYSKLKNIKVVNISGAVGSSGVSISGRTSLTMDIDPNIRNSNNEIVQHALKDSDPNIIFRNSGATTNSSLNDFSIELMASKVAKDSKINMGRKIHYEISDVKTGEKLKMRIPFISDSIAHRLIDNKEISSDSNSLLTVKVKDEIKRLDNSENEVYKSIKDSGKLNVLHPTLTSSNKRTTFSVLDDEREKSKKLNLAIYLKNKTGEEILKDLSQFNLTESNRDEVLTAIETVKSGKTISEIIAKEKLLNERIKSVNELEKNEKYKGLNLNTTLEELKKFNIENLKENKDDINIRNENTKKIKEIVDNINLESLDELKNNYTNLNLSELYTSIINAKSRASNVADKWDFSFLLSSIESLISSLDKQTSFNVKNLNEELKNIDSELVKNLELYGHDTKQAYEYLKSKLFYTVREEEALFELKNILSQIKDRNIYSKLNKISKNEISTYTNIPYEINHSLSAKKNYSRGGFISNRTVQDNFKGNIYTAYGLFEKERENSKDKYGLMIGGANSDHREIYERTLNTVATESSIEGVSAYLGTYYNKELANNLNWISGAGIQYGKYTVKRDMKNTYQNLKAKGNVDTLSATAHTGLAINYPIHEDVSVQLKGILSYSAVKQNKVNESGDLPLNIDSNLYHYVDAEAGLSFTKKLYGDNLVSSLSAGIYGVAGLTGYKNDDMNARVKGSSSSFNIKGDRIKKDAAKIFIDYNVQTDEGYNYGLEGTYISNSKENNVKIGIKGGYTF